AARPPALVSEEDVTTKSSGSGTGPVKRHPAKLGLVDVEVEVVVVEPRERDAQHAVHLAAGPLHALSDGVGDVAAVGPREVVLPPEELLRIRVAGRGE